MNPGQNQSPLDYLNQIAAPTTKRPGMKPSLRLLILIGGGLIILVITISIILSVVNGNRKAPWEAYMAKLATVQTVAEDATPKLKNSQLRSLNSDVKLYITNTSRELQPPLAALGIDPAKLPASVIATESASGVTERLETARLNAKFDSAYAREMSYQLAAMLSLLQKMYAQNNSAATQQILKTAYDNLQPKQAAIADFTAANE